jgi:glycolate oxidase FAD binding subunit
MTADSIPASLVEACEQVRLAGQADAVGEVQPRFVASPASTTQASSLLRAAAALGIAVLPRGTGSKLAWGNPPERADLVVETTGMNRVIEHAAGDLVASVEAGVGLDRLAEVLNAAGQRLALDPPSLGPWGRGTVGGVLASGVAGPLRLRYGSGRDLLIGITVVRADGTVAKSGGKVVKNVAGYDLGKLFAGSRGTLGLITEATFRLHPKPAATTYVTAPCAEPDDCARLLASALRAPVAPVAAELDWPSPDAPITLGIAIEGDQAGVAKRAALFAGLPSDAPPPWWGSGPAAQQSGTVLQVAFWAGDVAKTLTAIRACAERARLAPAIGGSAAGTLYVALPADADAGQVAGLITSLRSALGRGNGQPARASVVVQHAPTAVTELVDPFGPVSALGLMRAVKHRFDPERMMSPGRFVGGL